jgi:hypothetical protein
VIAFVTAIHIVVLEVVVATTPTAAITTSTTPVAAAATMKATAPAATTAATGLGHQWRGQGAKQQGRKNCSRQA